MQILGCKAFPVARIRMEVSDIGFAGKDGVNIVDNSSGKRTTIWIPRSVANKLTVGDIIEALCLVSPNFRLGMETYAVAVRRGNVTETIYAKSAVWSSEFLFAPADGFFCFYIPMFLLVRVREGSGSRPLISVA